ncbi:hypothetical protein [Rhizobium sp. S163]|uniref:hypothetical protein n=1 Tax=Rhizobium sp. S163 TaxID=3055039 RepID=UPI0025A949BA|nr:hypothetical protein [Rhizobium sp. S163]MDM9643861.1 hypothetical protein [Rhizobium sp. S163]
MIYILGFDPSKYTGWALYSPEHRKADGNFSRVKCGVLEMPEKADMYYTADQIGLKVTALLRDIKADTGVYPDFAVLEQQIEAQVSMQGRGQNFAGSISPWVATSAIVATLANFGIPYGTLMPSPWRKAFFGEGFSPPVDSKGKKDWKAAAVAECERIGIQLPKKKTLSHNAAEACALAICWGVREMKVHAGRYQEPLMALRMGRNERTAA